MSARERIAYLRGFIEGQNQSENVGLSKFHEALLGALEAITDELDDLKDYVGDVEDEVMDMQSELGSDEYDCCCCGDDDDEDDDDTTWDDDTASPLSVGGDFSLFDASLFLMMLTNTNS